MQLPSISLIGLIVTCLATGARASGYNESTYTGFENVNGGTYYPVSYTATPLHLIGFHFGTTNGLTLTNWVQQSVVSCNIGGSTVSDKTKCFIQAIKDAVLVTANGVIGLQGNYANMALIKQGNVNANDGGGASTYYASENQGQGVSCSPSTPYFGPANVNCTNLQTAGKVNSHYFLNSRGIKVTCKNACSSDANQLAENNLLSVVTSLANDMLSANTYAARFVLSRDGSPQYAIARCRLTIPYIAQYGMDACPDYIPAYGSAPNDVDSNWRPDL